MASCQKDILIINYEQQNQVTLNYSASFAEVQTDQSIDDCSYSSTINYNVTQNINATGDIDKNNITVDAIVNNNNNNSNNDNNKNNAMIDIIVIDNEAQLSCNIRENWRGLIRESQDKQCSTFKKRRKPTSYLDKCPEWDYIKLARDQNIPLIRNGNICKGVTIDNKVITICQTCAFDAVLHLVASGIASIKSYDDKIKLSENSTINLAMSILHAGKITTNHYKERAKILLVLSLFSDALTIYTCGISN